MIKRDWKSVEAAQDIEYKRMPAGGYICKITEVEDCPKGFDRRSPDKGDYLKVCIDVEEGEFQGYFAQSASKFGYWPYGGVYYASYKETALGMFKRFIEALEESNRRFEWDDGVSDNPKLLEGLEIGVVFREEEYTKNGETRSSVKPYSVYSVNAIDSGKYKVPSKKAAQAQQQTFETLSDDDTDLPF